MPESLGDLTSTEVRWASLLRYPDYEISSDGRIFSRQKWRGTSGRELAGSLNQKGYRAVRLHANGTGKTTPIHRIVAEAFLGPRPVGMEVRHLNGDKLDNSVGNLRYGTSSENRADSRRHGTMPVGTMNPGAKLDDSKIREILRLRASGVSTKDMGALFGVNPVTVRAVLSGRRWRHVPRTIGGAQ